MTGPTRAPSRAGAPPRRLPASRPRAVPCLARAACRRWPVTDLGGRPWRMLAKWRFHHDDLVVAPTRLHHLTRHD